MLADAILQQFLFPEFDHIMAGTRRSLERVPEARFDWRPHPRSWTLRELATHLAQLPQWGTMTIRTSELDLMPAGQSRPATAVPVTSHAELMERFDRHVTEARAAIAGAVDSDLRGIWSLKMAGRTIDSRPRIEVLRSHVLNHIIHHRAQLGVYLRLLDVPVPMQFGPTADEGYSR